MNSEALKNSSSAAPLGRIPSGLFILTARKDTQDLAMLASWVQQCAFDPPHLTVALQRERALTDAFREERPRVVVNILPENSKAFLSHFGKGVAPDQCPFGEFRVNRDRAAAAVLEDALAYLECQVVGNIEAGDHLVFVLEVLAGGVLHEGKPAVHIRKSGHHY